LPAPRVHKAEAAARVWHRHLDAPHLGEYHSLGGQAYVGIDDARQVAEIDVAATS
jgi:hypothetical protein